MADNYTQAQMWAHYADYHRGFCFEFDASAGLFAAAQPISYVATYPTINRLHDSRDVMLQKAMYTKHESWQSEREWRVVARPDNERAKAILAKRELPQPILDFYAAEHGSGYYDMPSSALLSVTFGRDSSESDRKWIESLIPNGVTRWVAETRSGTYDLHRRPLASALCQSSAAA